MKVNLKKLVTGSGIMLASGLMFASAHMGGMGGGHEGDMDSTKLIARFEQDAKILGVNVSEVKNYWSEGKNIFDIATEKGIATTTIEAKLKEVMQAEMTNKMNSLVVAGVITQAQADKRIALMKTTQENGLNHKMGKGGKRGMKNGEKSQSQTSTSGVKALWNKITN